MLHIEQRLLFDKWGSPLEFANKYDSELANYLSEAEYSLLLQKLNRVLRGNKRRNFIVNAIPVLIFIVSGVVCGILSGISILPLVSFIVLLMIGFKVAGLAALAIMAYNKRQNLPRLERRLLESAREVSKTLANPDIKIEIKSYSDASSGEHSVGLFISSISSLQVISVKESKDVNVLVIDSIGINK